MSKVLHIKVATVDEAPNGNQVTIGCEVKAWNEDDEINDTWAGTLGLKTLLLYNTGVQMNLALVAAVKTFMYDTYGVSTGAWDASYVIGGWGSL